MLCVTGGRTGGGAGRGFLFPWFLGLGHLPLQVSMLHEMQRTWRSPTRTFTRWPSCTLSLPPGKASWRSSWTAKDPRRETEKMLQFTGRSLPVGTMDLIVQPTSFEEMRKNPMANYTTAGPAHMDHTGSSFTRRGGAWPGRGGLGPREGGSRYHGPPDTCESSARTLRPLSSQASWGTGKAPSVWPRTSSLTPTMLRRWQAAASPSAGSSEC